MPPVSQQPPEQTLRKLLQALHSGYSNSIKTIKQARLYKDMRLYSRNSIENTVFLQLSELKIMQDHANSW